MFPHAPVRPVTINNGMPMRAWYDIYAADLANRADVLGVAQSQAHVEALIAREKDARRRREAHRRSPASRRAARSRCTPVSGTPSGSPGIVALSTYLPMADRLPKEAAAANRDLPIFMAHGTMDPMIRPDWGEASRRALVAAGYTVEWHTYPMPHSVVSEEISAVRAFLTTVLAPG